MNEWNGSIAEEHYCVSSDQIKAFYELSGDWNPLHSDAAYATKSGFAGVIVPGMLVMSLVSALLANKLPGPGTI